jgi:flotillin
MSMILLGVVIFVCATGFLPLFAAFVFRTVVPTNKVHTVQSKNNTKSFGKGLDSGNVYYRWPSWVPIIGITDIVMPTSIFDINLDNYSAYDQERLPFVVDVMGFFQVSDPETAAQRVDNFTELYGQLENILKGSIRSILANSPLESILGNRSEFGDAFTNEVAGQLQAWGVKAVKNIELMDIRDVRYSEVINNIMAKKKSEIEKESRTAVALNNKEAFMAEIDAEKEADVRKQEADLLVGQKTADKEREIGVAQQKALQEIKEEESTTAKKTMAVLKVEQELQADIDKNVALISAEQAKEVKRLSAEASLIQSQREAEGIVVNGQAVADAKSLLLMAPINAQITLAKEIGSNEPYMTYLLSLDGIKAGQVVGVAKAGAMKEADMKIITNSGSTEGGINKLMDVFSSKGGLELGSMLESMAQTPVGKSLLDKLTSSKKDKNTKTDKTARTWDSTNVAAQTEDSSNVTRPTDEEEV